MDTPKTPSAARFALMLAARLVHSVTHLPGLNQDMRDALNGIATEIRGFVEIV